MTLVATLPHLPSLVCTVCNPPNREVIAVNQDPLGVQGRLVKAEGGKTGSDYRVYSRPLQNGDVAVALLNAHSFSSPQNISFSFEEVR